MGRFAWLFLLIGILQGWVQAQSRLWETLTGETHTEISSSLIVSSIPEPRTPPPAASIHSLQVFQCNGRITLDACRQEVLIALKPLLDKYGADQLGQWEWVLIPSSQWEMVLTRNGLSPDVPAFTLLEAKVTFFDDALVTGSPQRLSQLMDAWHLGRSSLLDLAVRHELSHAFCMDVNESRAVNNERRLAEKRPPTCHTPSRSARK